MTAANDLLIGIDIGTTGAKAVLIDARARCLAEATREYPLSTPRPLWSEQDPHHWYDGAVHAIRDVLGRAAADPARVVGLSLTGQMHGLTLLDARGDVLRPAILWNDQRTGDQCAELTRRVGARRVLELTGNPILPGFTAPKITWVQQHEPDVHARIAHVLLPKDYVRFRLTGERFGDVSDCSGMSLFDVGRRGWSDEMLAAAEVRREWLPGVTESPVASTRLSTEAAEATSLTAGIPIAAGAGDQAAGAIGAGIVRSGLVSATLGTSGVVFAAADRYTPEPDGRLHAFCHAVPGKWHLMGVMLSAAGSFRWLRETVGQPEVAAARQQNTDAYDLLTALAAEAPAGCEGLLFLPYLSGERTPHPDPLARGAWVGLTLRHERAHLVRSVLEGVTFGLRDALELMRSMGITPSEVRAAGGGARSAFWRQLLADVFGAPIVTMTATQGAALGAALLAGVGAGVFPDVDAACAHLAVTDRCEPGPDRAACARSYEEYARLYPTLRETFTRLSRL